MLDEGIPVVRLAWVWDVGLGFFWGLGFWALFLFFDLSVSKLRVQDLELLGIWG